LPLTRSNPTAGHRLSDFDFDLPRELIALRPAEPRDAGKLLNLPPTGSLVHRRVSALPELLRPGDVLVFNDTRVIPARLTGRRDAVSIEVTLHKREGEDTWAAFAKPAKRLRKDQQVVFGDDLGATVVEKREAGEVVLRFSASGEALWAALERHGVMPLPPYIAAQRPPDAGDRETYQTVFAREPGAVAAPTAGLHFTDRLLRALDDRGVDRVTVTLHVGAGTFLPVKTEDIAAHKMHAEWGRISEAAAQKINDAREAGGRVVAVGTTSLRLLESAADPEGRLNPFDGETDIFITPGYRFRVTDVLMTNFHLPKSTLLMLVSAFSGRDRILAAYEEAKAASYRFYSYGDACLLERAT
jgi:S-adenosylmethionine:tRNA ribosyltransferase-isomerase